MSVERKKVKLMKNFNPDHNGECLGCDAWASDCECLYIVADEDPEAGDYALKGTEKIGVLERIYVQEILDGVASIGSGMALPSNALWRIIAEPNQISLTKEEQERIFRQDGSCDIEMDWYDAEDNGYRVPKLNDGKFIIHI